MDVEKARRIAEIVLSRYYVSLEWAREYSLFELLVAVILSQRTYWKNTRRALERFREKFKDPREVVKASVEEIAEIIRPAGLYWEKARVIKQLAWEIASGRIVLEDIVKLPYDEARRKLLEVKGIGLKTADVFLMLAGGHQIVPVDTHIARIAKRTGIVDEKAGYEDIRRVLEEAVRPEDRGKLHLALILFGRNICRPRRPRCSVCPIRDYCNYWLREKV